MSVLRAMLGVVVAGVVVLGWHVLQGNEEIDKEQVMESPVVGQDSLVVSEEVESDIPDLTLRDLDGNEVSLQSFLGRPLVINAWATWCPFCVDELPDMALVQREFGDGVVFVAIDRAELASTARDYLDGLGLRDEMVFLQDPGDSFYQAIGGFSMPETLFIGADGKLVFHKRGPMKLDEIRDRVSSLVK